MAVNREVQRLKLSRMAQDSILFEMSVTQDEITKLKQKHNDEGLSEPEWNTLKMLEKKLRGLRRITYENK